MPDGSVILDAMSRWSDARDQGKTGLREMRRLIRVCEEWMDWYQIDQIGRDIDRTYGALDETDLYDDE